MPATSSFVGMGSAEARLRDYHMLEDTGRRPIGSVLLLGLATAVFLGPVAYSVAAAATGEVAVGLAIAVVTCVLVVALAAFAGTRVSGILTVTDQRLIYYRRESGLFTEGHSYVSVWLRDVCGVIAHHERSWGKDHVGLSVLTANSDSIRLASGGESALARVPVLGPLFSKSNQGPDAERALKELPALLPQLRLGLVA